MYGSLITLLTIMKSLPLAYNKDMQEDKEAIFDAIDTVELCLPVFSAMVDTLTVRPKNMAKAAAGGFINATDCADYLVKKGMPFREAYMIVGRLVNMCIKTGETLDTLPLKDFRSISAVFDEDVYHALELKTCVNGRKVYGGPAKEAVEQQIANIKTFIEAKRSMKPNVYIDGKEGTTGLQIYDRLSGREDINLLLIDDDRRRTLQSGRST